MTDRRDLPGGLGDLGYEAAEKRKYASSSILGYNYIYPARVVDKDLSLAYVTARGIEHTQPTSRDIRGELGRAGEVTRATDSELVAFSLLSPEVTWVLHLAQSKSELRRMPGYSVSTGDKVRRTPSTYEFLAGNGRVTRIRREG